MEPMHVKPYSRPAELPISPTAKDLNALFEEGKNTKANSNTTNAKILLFLYTNFDYFNKNDISFLKSLVGKIRKQEKEEHPEVKASTNIKHLIKTLEERGTPPLSELDELQRAIKAGKKLDIDPKALADYINEGKLTSLTQFDLPNIIKNCGKFITRLDFPKILSDGGFRIYSNEWHRLLELISKECPNLKILNLRRLHISFEHLPVLSKLPSLQELNLEFTDMAYDLTSLKNLTNLRKLVLSNTRVTQESVSDLRNSNPALTVKF